MLMVMPLSFTSNLGAVVFAVSPRVSKYSPLLLSLFFGAALMIQTDEYANLTYSYVLVVVAHVLCFYHAICSALINKP